MLKRTHTYIGSNEVYFAPLLSCRNTEGCFIPDTVGGNDAVSQQCSLPHNLLMPTVDGLIRGAE